MSESVWQTALFFVVTFLHLVVNVIFWTHHVTYVLNKVNLIGYGESGFWDCFSVPETHVWVKQSTHSLYWLFTGTAFQIYCFGHTVIWHL